MNITKNNDTRDIILNYVIQLTGKPIPLTDEMANKDFRMLGLDSITYYQLQLQIETRFHLTLDDDFLLRHPTAKSVVEYILNNQHQP